MTKPCVGDRIRVVPETFGNWAAAGVESRTKEARKPYPGTVTYVHPRGWWFQVTFDGSGIKECFFWC